jgi:post-segregation antitoxin (ccd killing protein)
MQEATKIISLRLSEKQAAELAAVARAEEVSVSKALRVAVQNHITKCRADQEFQERLRKRLEEDREILERLAE